MAKKKVSDELCKRYLSLKEKIKKAEKECEEIKGICLETGSWQSTKYNLSVWEKESRSLSVPDVVQHFGVAEKDLEKIGLLKITPYKQIKITTK